ncbi:MAG: hypothetical protein CMO01_15000 [Thalassobius sp.]|nr:hypothetical protein [Thalassovita sp.]
MSFLQLRKLKKYISSKLSKPAIVAYRGYGNAESIYMSGRLVKSYGLKNTVEGAWRIWNLLAMLERYLTPGISGVELEVCFNDQKQRILTDERGFFEVRFRGTELENPEKSWYTGDVKFLTSIHRSVDKTEIHHAEVLIPSSECEYGIISDIDDTFLISYSTSFFLKMRQLLWKNAFTRKTFSGASIFYNALLDGMVNGGKNPFFYVSSSDWNLYDLLVDFCDLHKIPKGVFMLNDFRKRDSLKFKFWKGGLLKHGHKYDKIKTIFESYPNLKFILLGDSGQKDAEIYKEVVEEYPDRILSIYIRDIGSESRQVAVNSISDELWDKYNVNMVLMEHSDKGAKHAVENRYIAYENVKQLLKV